MAERPAAPVTEPRDTWLAPGLRRLRPMDLGDLLDHAFRLYRENLGCFLGIILVVNVLVFGLENLLQVDRANRRIAAMVSLGPDGGLRLEDPAGLIQPALVIWCFLLACFVVTQLSMAALTFAASRRFLQEPTGIIASYRAVLRRFPLLLATGLLAGLCYTALCAMFCLPGLLLMAAFVFAPLEIVLEGSGPVRALVRSFHLTVRGAAGRGFHHSFFKISTILTLFTLVSLSAYMLATTPRMVLYGYIHWTGERPDVAVGEVTERVLRTLEYLGISAAEPLGMTALVLLYYDIRMRVEGFDLERSLRGPQP